MSDQALVERPDGKEAEAESNGGWQAPVALLAALPRALAGAIEDVRTIARGMQVLPELARTLAAIERRTESLDNEVRKMRQAVESMGEDVSRIDPRLDEVQSSLRPMRRLGNRIRRSTETD